MRFGKSRAVWRLLQLLALARWLWIVFCLLAAGRVEAEPTTVLAVRSLSAEEARKGNPVEVTATVIFTEGKKGSVFIQDSTAGTYVHPAQAVELSPGDEVEVQGVTGFGLYLPGIEQGHFHVSRHGDLPKAADVSYSDLLSGRFHYQRVAVEGVVHAVNSTDEGRSRLQIALGQNLLEVRVFQSLEKMESLVDSRVRVEGLAAGAINHRHQLVEPAIWVPDWNGVSVLEPAPSASAVPLVSVADVLSFRVKGQGGNRVCVSGTVIAIFGDGELFLRDGETAMSVRLGLPSKVEAGDRVEIMGFPEMRRFSASLENATVLTRKPGPPPPPVAVNFPKLFDGLHDGDLVTVSAMVSGAFQTDDGGVLVLQDKGHGARAYVPQRHGEPPVGSLVKVTGVCVVESTQSGGFRSKPVNVGLRLRSAADVTLVRAPSPWNARRFSYLLFGLAFVILLAALWISALKRQVHLQTAALRNRIQSEAALEERQRIAREFHDTLEQGLAGLSLRLDAVATRQMDEKGRSLLLASRGLVSQIQAETRNLVSDLRDVSVTGDIGAALESLAERYPMECSAKLELEIAMPLPPLAPRTVHHLRMIAQEAVTNALKHAQASRIRLGLQWTANRLNMTIADDGIGFEAEASVPGKAGHFGCVGIVERCEKIRAEAAWQSRRGEGTRVAISLPVSQRPEEEPGVQEKPNPLPA